MRISDWSSDVCSSDLALRGDVPGGEPYRAHPDGYANAAELVAGLKTIAPFDISVAAYPEVHPASDCPQTALDNPKRKLVAGPTLAITPFFLDRKSVVLGKSVSVRVALGCIIITNIL